ncbi:MAG: class I SAM-dependent methyltransferase, partial [Anaerolineae bacterium]|nr:class I SAM-dependent methyltransferase [Anaerolineae bacterium]
DQAARRWAFDTGWHTLDLACGSGEATLALQALGFTHITGCDPYTGEAYTRRTGRITAPCRFEQIAAQGLPGVLPYDLVVCSFALHLVAPSRLPALAYRLAEGATRLLVISPHKRPQIKPEWGWQVIGEFVHERVRTRFYHSAVQSGSLNTMSG